MSEPADSMDDEIGEAIYDAVCDGEGRATAHYLKHHLRKRGLYISVNSASRTADLEMVLRRVRDFVEDEHERRDVVGINEESEYWREPKRILAIIDVVLAT